jgi:hypothetical protein
LCLWKDAKDHATESMSEFVGVRMLDGSQWGCGQLAGVEKGLKTREGVPFRVGLSGVEIVRRVGWSIAYCWLTDAHITSLSARKGRCGGLQW